MSEKTQIQVTKGPGFGTYLWRFLTGNHMDGVERMNTSWLRRGTEPEHHDNWWNRKARLERAAWRWGVLAILFSSLYGWFAERMLTAVCLALLLAYLLIKMYMGIHAKIYRPIRVGYGDFTLTHKMVRPHLTQKWENFRRFFIWETVPDNDMPPDVKKAMLAENAEDNQPPIIEARLVRPGEKK